MLNIVAISYSIKVARRLVVVSSNLHGMREVFESFRSNIEDLHNSEIFYGDQSLQSLMEQSQMVLDEIEKHEDIFMLIIDEEDEEDEEDFEDIKLG